MLIELKNLEAKKVSELLGITDEALDVIQNDSEELMQNVIKSMNQEDSPN